MRDIAQYQLWLPLSFFHKDLLISNLRQYVSCFQTHILLNPQDQELLSTLHINEQVSHTKNLSTTPCSTNSSWNASSISSSISLWHFYHFTPVISLVKIKEIIMAYWLGGQRGINQLLITLCRSLLARVTLRVESQWEDSLRLQQN